MVKALSRFLAAAALLLGATAAHASPVYDQVFPSPSTIKCSSDASCAILDHIRVQAVTYSGNAGSAVYTWATPCGGVVDGVFYIQPTGATVGCFQMEGFMASATPGAFSLANTKILVGNASNIATAVNMSADATIANTGAVTLANSGVSAGTYTPGSVTFDAKGRATSANSTLSSGNIFVGNGSNVSAPVAVSGDATLANTGALTVSKSQSLPIVTTVASFSAMSALATPSAIAHVFVQGTGGGQFDYSAAALTVDGCTIFAASDGKYWVRSNTPTTEIRVSQCDTFAHADAYGVAKAIQLDIDVAQTLAAPLTISSPTVYATAAITRGANNLTISGVLLAPHGTQVLPHGSGTLALPGTQTIDGTWFTGPYGNTGLDYQPGLQDAINLVMRCPNSGCGGGGLGPRTLDLRGGTSSQNGIYLNTSLTFPTDPADGTILDNGQSIVMNTDNTPIFVLNSQSLSGNIEGTNWSVRGDRYTEYRWLNPQPVANNGAVVFVSNSSGAGTLGQRSIWIQGGTLINAWGLIKTGTGTAFNGWWDSRIENIVAVGPTGTVIQHIPPAGGAERQIYQNILVTGPASPVVSVFDIELVGGLTLDNWSIDNAGATTASTSRLLNLRNLQNFRITNGHIESCTFSSTPTEIFFISSSYGNVNGLQLASNTLAASAQIALFNVAGTSTLSNVYFDNISSTNMSLGAGANIYLANSANPTNGNLIRLGQGITLGTTWLGLENATPLDASRSFIMDNTQRLDTYTTGITGTIAETVAPGVNGSLDGIFNSYPYWALGITYNLSAALTSTHTITLNIRTGGVAGTLLATCTITSSMLRVGTCLWQWAKNLSASTATVGQGTVLTYQSSGVVGTLTMTADMFLGT